MDEEVVGLTPTQQVYEFVFNEVMQDAVSEILISNRLATPAEIGEVVTITDAKLDSSIPSEEFHKLLKLRRDETQIDWSPIMITARFIELPSQKIEEGIDFWKEFAALYGEGRVYYVVSDVVFDYERSTTLFLFGYRCAVLCGGHDSLVYLKKVGSEWRVVATQMLWVS